MNKWFYKKFSYNSYYGCSIDFKLSLSYMNYALNYICYERIITQVMLKLNISSVIMWLIPGMKNIVPNQRLAITLSEKYILPQAFYI